MMRHLQILIFPLIISNVLHMIIVRKNFLPALCTPVNTQLFGVNKTWRGFFLLPLLNAIILPFFEPPLSLIHAVLLGAILGLTFMIFELPNSFMKRRMGISPGESPQKKKILFALIDKSDSAFGVMLVYFFLSDITLRETLTLFFLGVFAHIAFSLLLVQLRIKRSF